MHFFQIFDLRNYGIPRKGGLWSIGFPLVVDLQLYPLLNTTYLQRAVAKPQSPFRWDTGRQLLFDDLTNI